MTTEQQPIHSGFNAKSTARDVIAGIDLSGKIAIVTGGYSGIGVETTRALSEAGATVVVPVRTRISPVLPVSSSRRSTFSILKQSTASRKASLRAVGRFTC